MQINVRGTDYETVRGTDYERVSDMTRANALKNKSMRRFQPDPSRYEIESNVGEGLNASVFKAIRVDGRERSRQHVALKFLKDKTAVEILRREFETLSKVRSQYCARVMSWESCGDECALVLEWIDGPTLFDLSRRLQLSETEIDEILLQIRRGLSDLRELGLHHGDLHPGNVMIDSSGTVRLLDFANTNGKKSGDVIQGCPSFLAPEIWKGATTSFETDLFALGIIEKGLVHGFDRLSEREQARGSGLLSENTKLRVDTFESDCVDSISSANVLPVRILSKTVNRYLAQHRADRTRVIDTDVPELTIARKLATVASSVVIALSAISAVSIPVNAEAPLLVNELKSKIAVNTINWAEISLNGKKVGYAPVVISNLRPGKHRIAWKSAFGSGELSVQLQSDEVLRVSEADLRVSKRTKVRDLSKIVNR